MNSSKYFPKLLNCFNALSISKIKIRCSCSSLLIQQNCKVKTRLTLLTAQRRYYSTEKGSNDEDKNESQNTKILGGGLSNYEIFEDDKSPVILDIEEERRLLEENPELLEELNRKEVNKFFGVNRSRGEKGVFEIDELVMFLRNDNALNVVTIAIPDEFRYVDYMVVVSGRSFKHLYAMAEFIKKLYKLKRHESDPVPKIEGFHLSSTNPSDWLALDLGNIVLHLFLEPVRRKYDLETLWAVGHEYDDLYHAKDNDYISLLKEHTRGDLKDLVPLDDSLSTEERKNLA